MGKIIRLTGVSLTDNSAPRIILRDPIESVGSLFLFDGARQYGQFSGLPPASQTIPNVLSDRAAALLSAHASSLDLTVASGSITSKAGIFLAERTGKGGIHGISTLSGNQTTADYYVLLAPDVIRAHIQNNPTRSFYASIWSVVTRQGIHNAANQSIFHQAPNTNNLVFAFPGGTPSYGNNLGFSTSPSGHDYGTGPTVPYARFGALGWSQHIGAGPGTSPLEFGVGNFGAWSGFNQNKTASRIIYRAYLEDLTASGRTFAQVQAIDYALFQAAFAPGGKFADDTYTSPSTLP